MRRKTRITTCLLGATGAVVAMAVPAGAQDVASLQAQIDSARSEAQGLAAEIESKTAALSGARAEAQAAAAREAELSGLLVEGRERAAELAARVAQTRGELEEARARLRRALDALADRLVAIYKGDMPDATTLILEADGFDDLTTRTEYLREIEDADAALADRVRQLRNEVATKLEAFEQAHAEAEAYNERLETARAQIAAARAAAEQQAAALAAARAEQQSALASLQGQVDGWMAQVSELQAAQAAAAEQAATTDPASAQQEVASWVGDYAIPQSIVMCESGGNYDAVNPSSGAGGAYQILPSTWELYGGSGDPEDAPPAQQDEVAAQIWADSGSSAWVCAG